MARPKRAVTTAKAAVAKTAEPKATEVKEVKAEEKKVVEEKAAAKTTAKKTTRKPACKVSTCVELNGLSVSVAEVEAAVKKAQGHQPVGTKQRRRQMHQTKDHGMLRLTDPISQKEQQTANKHAQTRRNLLHHRQQQTGEDHTAAQAGKNTKVDLRTGHAH